MLLAHYTIFCHIWFIWQKHKKPRLVSFLQYARTYMFETSNKSTDYCIFQWIVWNRFHSGFTSWEIYRFFVGTACIPSKLLHINYAHSRRLAVESVRSQLTIYIGTLPIARSQLHWLCVDVSGEKTPRSAQISFKWWSWWMLSHDWRGKHTCCGVYRKVVHDWYQSGCYFIVNLEQH